VYEYRDFIKSSVIVIYVNRFYGISGYITSILEESVSNVQSVYREKGIDTNFKPSIAYLNEMYEPDPFTLAIYVAKSNNCKRISSITDTINSALATLGDEDLLKYNEEDYCIPEKYIEFGVDIIAFKPILEFLKREKGTMS